MTYVLQGGLVWKYVRDVLQKGFPEGHSRLFKRLPRHIDSAFAFNRKIYFTSGRHSQQPHCVYISVHNYACVRSCVRMSVRMYACVGYSCVSSCVRASVRPCVRASVNVHRLQIQFTVAYRCREQVLHL